MNVLKMLFTTAALSFALNVSAQAMLSDKVYDTGEALKKPMVMTPFTEFKHARKLADMDLYTLDGDKVDLAKYRGNVIILNIWASWCQPCIREIPALIRLQEELKDSNIKIFGVSVDDAVKQVPKFLARNKMSDFQTWIDPKKTVDNVIPLTVVPTNYIIDGEGNLVGILRGYLPWEDPEVIPFLKKLEQKYATPQKVQTL